MMMMLMMMMFIWYKMLWEERERAVELRGIYQKTTQFILDAVQKV